MARKKQVRRKVPVLSSRQFGQRLGRGTISAQDLTAYLEKYSGKLTPTQIQKVLDLQDRRQREAAAARRIVEQDRARARTARRRFRPKRSDWGKVIKVTVGGKRAGKKQKGLPVYVTKTGKKRVLRQGGPRPLGPKKRINLKLTKTYRRVKEAFQRAQLETTAEGVATKGQGSVKAGGAHDFRESVINTIAASIRRTIEAQRSHRSFLIQANLLLRHGDGTSSALSFDVPIDRADHLAIKIAGVRNFVQQKWYAFQARAMQYAGFISAGSATHIKRVMGTSGVDEYIWEQYHNEKMGRNFSWTAPRFEVVTVERIGWRIQQAK